EIERPCSELDSDRRVLWTDRLPSGPRALSEARVGKKRTGAHSVCALPIQRHEGSRTGQVRLPLKERRREKRRSQLSPTHLAIIVICPSHPPLSERIDDSLLRSSFSQKAFVSSSYSQAVCSEHGVSIKPSLL